MQFLCLLRGINVGGKNKISMPQLSEGIVAAGFDRATTYLNSGNVIVTSSENNPQSVEQKIEKLLPKMFDLDSDLIRVRAMSRQELEQVISKAPKDFGAQPDTFHSDVLFPIDVSAEEIMQATVTNPDVDTAWLANGVVYYQRLTAQLTKSRLSKIIASPVYKHLTIRSWNTTVKLLALMEKEEK